MVFVSEYVIGEPLTPWFVLTKVLRKRNADVRFEFQQDLGERKTCKRRTTSERWARAARIAELAAVPARNRATSRASRNCSIN
ncbi:hypothetical protein PCAR4_920012 [Paraburkholderia caribensis]|nr:hypothetical protein PCAR4_920012 [Paraburkholderia caribensis]